MRHRQPNRLHNIIGGGNSRLFSYPSDKKIKQPPQEPPAQSHYQLLDKTLRIFFGLRS